MAGSLIDVAEDLRVIHHRIAEAADGLVYAGKALADHSDEMGEAVARLGFRAHEEAEELRRVAQDLARADR